ncbi:unnamed protein product [Calypogeia fissa]
MGMTMPNDTVIPLPNDIDIPVPGDTAMTMTTNVVVDMTTEPLSPPRLGIREREVVDLDSPPPPLPKKKKQRIVSVIINYVPEGFITTSRKPVHDKFWRDMALHNFVHLPWDTTIGTDKQISEFINNYGEVGTMVEEKVINLIEEELATIFRLGQGEPLVGRARKWDSKKFSQPKDKNGFKLSLCKDPLLVDQLEFMRATLYMQDR